MHAARLASRRRGRRTPARGERGDDPLDETQRQLLALMPGGGRAKRFQHRECRQRPRRRRQACDRKSKAAGRRRARRNLAEELFTNIQGDAAIAAPMRVTAFKAPAIVSEQQCAGIEQPLSDVRAIGEASLDDGRDAESLVPLLEGPVGRSGATDDVMHAPPVSGRERSLRESLVRRLGRARRL